jgi:hypothetical protein
MVDILNKEIMMNWVKGIPPRYMRDHMGMFTGGENRLGWHGEMDRCWMDNDENLCVCSRIIRTQFGNVEHVTISKGTGTNDGTGEVSWAMKQQIKDELFGENRFAIEIFPKQKNLVDVCDVYHLWVFDKKVDMPFGIAPKEYQKAINRGYNVSDADVEKLWDDYKRTGKL